VRIAAEPWSHRLFWLACLAAGLVITVACFLPAIEFGDTAYIGAGDEQRSFVFNRSLTLAGYVRPGSLPFLVGGPLLTLAGLYGLARGTRAPAVVLVCAVSIAAAVQSLRIAAELQWTEIDSGVAVCGRADEDRTLDECAPFLAPAIRDLQREVLARPIARDPEFGLLGGEDGYRARGLAGWRLLQPVVYLLAPWASYRLLRLRIQQPPIAFALVTLGVMVVLLVLFLRALEDLA